MGLDCEIDIQRTIQVKFYKDHSSSQCFASAWYHFGSEFSPVIKWIWIQALAKLLDCWEREWNSCEKWNSRPFCQVLMIFYWGSGARDISKADPLRCLHPILAPSLLEARLLSLSWSPSRDYIWFGWVFVYLFFSLTPACFTVDQGSIFRSENNIYSPTPFWQWYFFPLSRHVVFFYSHYSLFALILSYFAFILPFYFPFSHFLSPFFLFLSLPFSFTLLPISLSPFFLFLLHFPPSSFCLFIFVPPNYIGWYFYPPAPWVGEYFPIYRPLLLIFL